jgi:hypothetical protein
MTVYFAGGSHYDFLEGKPILESFWYRRSAEKGMHLTSNFFLDSGAFSAFTQGKTIPVEAFAEFVKTHGGHLQVVSSLDAIGDAAQSLALYKQLIGPLDCPQVIPVFHCREDVRFLKEYLAMGVPYLALGGMVPESTTWLYSWLDDLWANYLTDDDGAPIVRVHGFGLTVGTLIERYPWYSVDSTTWLNGARFGTGIFNFEGRRLVHVPVSPDNPAAKQINSRHLNNLTVPEYESALAQIEAAGMTVDDIRDYTEKLLEFNCYTFLDWERRYGFPKTFTVHTQRGLL